MNKSCLLQSAVCACFMALTWNVNADTLLEFNFENFIDGQQVGPHSAALQGITGTHDMANNGVETFGPLT